MKPSKLARIEVLEVRTAAHQALLDQLVSIHQPPRKSSTELDGGDYAKMIAAGVLLGILVWWMFSPQEG